ncbi:MAG: type II toxin-antitoxin system HicB family antitoxin [Desulfarculus sp.]|nr:type II toxin-antitoxin system HicB family antitoxin [Desulfarculus sp.]
MDPRVLIHVAEEGGFWAEVPAQSGCVSEGDTWDEVLANVREAVEGWLLVEADKHQPLPAKEVVHTEPRRS